MGSVIDGVDRRTKLAGHNRLEILMFHLDEDKKQVFGINVFKVQEVIQCPQLTKIPNSHPNVLGIADIRGKTLPVIDLASSVGMSGNTDYKNKYLIISEYNRTIQGFLVSSVDRIVNMTWEEIKAPPKGMGRGCYLTAVTEVEDNFVEIIDVEKVFSEIIFIDTHLNDEVTDAGHEIHMEDRFVMVVDDSMVARNQIKKPLDDLDIKYETARDGKEALDMLKDWADNDPVKLKKLALIISDVEMPKMDGYTLVTEIRDDQRLANKVIILHSSLSGNFNKAMVKKVGADEFVAKYDPNMLSEAVLARLKNIAP